MTRHLYRGALFIVHGGSELRLCSVNVARCGGAPRLCQNGGAVAVYSGSELVLESVRISESPAFFGGAVLCANRSRVSATDCTMSSNSAE